MLFKALLLTPLLFIQMWVGAGLVPHQNNLIKETSSALTIELPTVSVVKAPEQVPPNLIALYLASLLVCILYFSLSNTKINNIKKFITIIAKPVKSVFLKRVVSKTKNAYYSNFHSLINSLQSI